MISPDHLERLEDQLDRFIAVLVAISHPADQLLLGGINLRLRH